jgi:hypothetical protein
MTQKSTESRTQEGTICSPGDKDQVGEIVCKVMILSARIGVVGTVSVVPNGDGSTTVRDGPLGVTA